MSQKNLLTAAQMRHLEQSVIAAGHSSGVNLMEQAARGVVAAIESEWPDIAPGCATVLCGPGNNGGDGFAIARLLQKGGWTVAVWLYGDPDNLPPDARANYESWSGIGPVTCRAINPTPLVDDTLHISPETTLLVDALFGTGLTRPFGGLFSMLVEHRDLIRDKGCSVVAVDIPSGLCSDSGRILGRALSADLTVTFHKTKLGHVLGQGPETCGRVVVAPIGLPEDTIGTPRVIAPDVDLLRKSATGHKFDNGHALVLTGGFGRTGAARLAAKAALRVGAGLVTLGVPGSAQMEVAAQITALMMQRVDDADALATCLSDLRYTALCLGPALGHDRALRLVPAAMSAPSVVLDADALSAFAEAPEALFRHVHPRCVLTPHGGEFARLFPDLAERLTALPDRGPAYSKLDATRDAAARAGCVVLFKGADTVIAAPDGRAAIHAARGSDAAPWLATAGSGDVLAGVICGLMARGMAPFDAAQAGAWLHASAARRFGPGLIAEDLPDQIPAVLQDLKV